MVDFMMLKVRIKTIVQTNLLFILFIVEVTKGYNLISALSVWLKAIPYLYLMDQTLHHFLLPIIFKMQHQTLFGVRILRLRFGLKAMVQM